MEDIVQAALDQADKEHGTTEPAREFGDPEIVALGCGEAGVTAVKHVADRTTVVNTIEIIPEKQGDQSSSKTDFTFIVDSSTVDHGLAFGTPAKNSSLKETPTVRQLVDILERADLCFIIGQPTTRAAFAATSVAAVAVEQSSALGIGLLTVTTAAEERQDNPAPMSKLFSTVDMATLLDRERVQTAAKGVGRGAKVVTTSEELSARFVVNAATTVVEPSLINLDYADLTSIWQRGDIGTLATAVVKNQSVTRMQEVARHVIDQPLYPINHTQVGGCWINIVGGPDITLKTAEGFAQGVTEHPALSDIVSVIWSARIVNHMEGEIQVETLLTGTSLDDLPPVLQPE